MILTVVLVTLLCCISAIKSECNDEKEKVEIVLNLLQVAIDWSNVSDAHSSEISVYYKESSDISYFDVPITSGDTSVALPIFANNRIYFIKFQITPASCLLYFYVATGDGMTNCQAGIYDLLLKVIDTQEVEYFDASWTDEGEAEPLKDALSNTYIKSFRYSSTIFKQFCFGLEKSNFEGTKWTTVTPVNPGTLLDAFKTGYAITESFNAIQTSLQDSDSMRESLDGNEKSGFNILLNNKYIKFGAIWKMSGNHYTHLGIGHEVAGANPKVGFLRVDKSGKIESESTAYDGGFFFGLREVKKYELTGLALGNCTGFDQVTCGKGFFEGQCKVAGVNALIFCPGMKTCAVECELTAPAISLKQTESRAISLLWNNYITSNMQDESNFLGYQLEYKKSSSSAWNVVPDLITATEFKVEELTPYTSYDFRMMVKANSMSVTDSYSTATHSTLPAAPTVAPNVTITSLTSNCVYAAWIPIPLDQMNGNFDAYVIEIVDSLSFVIVTKQDQSTTANSYQYCELTAFTKYYIRMHLKTDSGAGPNDLKEFKTLGAVPNDVPVPVMESRNTSALLVSWEFPESDWNSETLLKYYVHHIKDGIDDKLEVVSTENQAWITGLQPFTGYTVGITAVNSEGESTLTNMAEMITDSTVPGKGPSIVEITNIDKNTVNVVFELLPKDMWFSELLDVEKPYTVWYNSTLQDRDSVTSTNADETVENLHVFTEYEFSVVAKNLKGYGAVGDVFKHRTLEDKPSKAPDVTGNVISHSSVELSWSEIDLENRNGIIIKYEYVCIKLDDETKISDFVVHPQTNVTVSGLTDETKYNCTVSACTSVGCKMSEPIQLETPTMLPLSAAEIVDTHFVNATSIFVMWNDISIWGMQEEKQFCIVVEEVMTQSVREHIVDFPTLDTTITDLQPYTEYNISVYCKNKEGSGPKDGERKSVRTDELPPDVPPTEIQFPEVQSNNLTISWKPPSDNEIAGKIKSYNISINATEETVNNLAVHRRLQRHDVDTFSYSGPLLLYLSVIVSNNFTNVTVNNLFGNAEYNVSISSNTKYLGVYSQGMLITTLPGVPLLAAWDFRCGDATFTNIQVLWNRAPDLLIQGTLVQYTLYVRETGETFETVTNYTGDRLEVWSYSLKPFSRYSFSISAWTVTGEGNRTAEIDCKTKEFVPSRPPDYVSCSSFEFPDAANVNWFAIPEQYWRGNLLGYVIYYKIITQGEMYIQQPWQEVYTNNINTSYVLTNLTVYSTYKLKVAGYTKVGAGPKSGTVNFETCRVVGPKMTVNYFIYEPFIIMPDDSSTMPSGIMIESTHRGLLHCACQCSSFKENVHVEYIMLKNYSSLHEIVHFESTQIVIPYSNPNKVTYGFRYTATITTPGFALLQTPDSVEFILERNELDFLKNVLEAMHVFILYVALNGAFGAIFFCCEMSHSEHRENCYSIFGIFEGIYLAIMTSTTVGYGDKVPVTTRGRLYIVLWTLLGLVATGICVGNLSSALSTASLLSLKQLYPKDTVIAVAESPEFKWAASKMNLDTETIYKDHSDVIRALANRKVKHGVIDQYAMESLKPNLSSTGILVVKLYKSDESEFGASLGGSNSHLVNCIKNFQKDNEEIVEKAVESMKASVKKIFPDSSIPELPVEEIAVISFEAPLFRKVLFSMCIIWFLLNICGGVYEFRRLKRLRSIRNRVASKTDTALKWQSDLLECLNDSREDFEAMAKRFTQNTDAILFRHGVELMNLTKSYSKLYGVNFKYVAIKELGVPLEKIAEYREELRSRPVVPWHRRMRDYVSKKIAWLRIKIDVYLC